MAPYKSCHESGEHFWYPIIYTGHPAGGEITALSRAPKYVATNRVSTHVTLAQFPNPKRSIFVLSFADGSDC